MKRRVVVTGLGIVTPLGWSVDQCWNKVLAGESGVSLVSLFDTSDLRVKIGGDIKDWDPTKYIDQRECNRIDRFTQFAMVAASEAIEKSQLDFSNLDPFRSGVVIGSGIGGMTTLEEQLTRLVLKGPNRVSPMTIPKLMLNAAGSNIAIRYGLRGVNYSVATACASATNAMGDAFNLIKENYADIIVTGGSESAMTRVGLSAFQNMRALSERNDSPAEASRPFDSHRDGFVFSEGAGVLVFEEMEHALQRGATIFAEIIGYGTGCDAGHITQPDLDGKGAARAMQLALDDANLEASQIDYINAHGTSTPLGDKAETEAVKQVFGKHAHQVAISSTKSQLGHSLGASGGIEIILTIRAIIENKIPPTINLTCPDPECDLDYTPNEFKERQVSIAMSNSFGFGGHNASILVRSFSP